MPVSYGSVRGRVHRNVQPAYVPPPEEPAPKPRAVAPKVACSNGGLYASVAEAARDCGLKDSAVTSAMASGRPVLGLRFRRVRGEADE